MRVRTAEVVGIGEILERKPVELARLRMQAGIAFGKRGQPVDKIRYASEWRLATRNVDRDSTLMRQVKAALERLLNGCFGTCVDYEEAISSKRLAAVPWPPHCIRCPDAARRERRQQDDASEASVNAA